jgi:hypothetical protein
MYKTPRGESPADKPGALSVKGRILMEAQIRVNFHYDSRTLQIHNDGILADMNGFRRAMTSVPFLLPPVLFC